MESLKVCLTFPEICFCICQPDLALQSLKPKFHGSEDSI